MNPALCMLDGKCGHKILEIFTVPDPPLAHTPPPLSQIFHPGIYPPTEVVLSDSNIESLRSEEIKTKPDPLSGDDNSNVVSPLYYIPFWT
mgnify:CR=1 FL=1